jgi:predicted aspartyl protease
MKNYALSNLDSGERLVAILTGVSVSTLEQERHHRTWSAKVDTGASRTVIPKQICDDLRMKPRGVVKPIGFDPDVEHSPVGLHYVRIEVPGFAPVPVCACAVKRQSIVLGRDFLKELVFLINEHESRFGLAPWTPFRGVISRLFGRL